MGEESLEEVHDLVEPEGISKVLEQPGSEVIGSNGSDLNGAKLGVELHSNEARDQDVATNLYFRIRSELPSYTRQRMGYQSYSAEREGARRLTRTLEEQRLGSLEEPHLGFLTRNRVEFSEATQTSESVPLLTVIRERDKERERTQPACSSDHPSTESLVAGRRRRSLARSEV
jgi:hypothetical protein